MATDLVGNEQLQHFIKLLCDLNRAPKEANAVLRMGNNKTQP